MARKRWRFSGRVLVPERNIEPGIQPSRLAALGHQTYGSIGDGRYDHMFGSRELRIKRDRDLARFREGVVRKYLEREGNGAPGLYQVYPFGASGRLWRANEGEI